jgi:hypothetical protein
VERRYVLIGAHLREVDVPNVTWFRVDPVYVSAIEFDADHGTANPDVIRRALEARKALVERGTFVAIRYGVTVSGAQDAMVKCVAHAARWREILQKHDGTVEVTLRVGGTEKPVRPDRKEFRTGADYLRALHVAAAPKVSDQTRRAVEVALLPVSIAHKWLSRADGGSEFVALVRREKLEDVRRAGEVLQSQLLDVPFLLSGPWPLEAFGDAEE